MKIHPVAELFPMMSGAELSDMAVSIKKEGQINPCTRQNGVLLDGRNRIAACKLAGVDPRFIEYTGDSPVSFIIGANLSRRHLEKGQKIALGVEIMPHFEEEAKKRQQDHGGTAPGRKSLVENVPQVIHQDSNHKPYKCACGGSIYQGRESEHKCQVKSRDQAAASVGVSGKLLSAAKAIKEASPVKFQEIISGKKSVAKAKKEIKAEQDKRDLTNAQESLSAEKRQSINSVCDLRVCSCAELFASGIKPDAVITDPPYPQEFLGVFTELAESCKRVGVPLVAVMSGQSYLPEVMERLCRHLRYRWMIAYMTPGGQAVQQWQAKVNASWKPVILFGEAVDWLGDVAVSKPNDNDKRFHGWGQSESGMADLVQRLTKPGQMVCDPFLGAGTTAVACMALGRRFVGCDINADHVKQALARVMSCQA